MQQSYFPEQPFAGRCASDTTMSSQRHSIRSSQRFRARPGAPRGSPRRRQGGIRLVRDPRAGRGSMRDPESVGPAGVLATNGTVRLESRHALPSFTLHPPGARSSVGEHRLHTAGVAGSIPAAPTTHPPDGGTAERARRRRRGRMIRARRHDGRDRAVGRPGRGGRCRRGALRAHRQRAIGDTGRGPRGPRRGAGRTGSDAGRSTIGSPAVPEGNQAPWCAATRRHRAASGHPVHRGDDRQCRLPCSTSSAWNSPSTAASRPSAPATAAESRS